MAGVLTRLVDAFRSPEAPVPAPVALRDSGVVNTQTGLGMTADASVYNRHFFRPLSPLEIDQAYRGSWLMRKLIDLPAREQVRTRRNWQADKAAISKLEAEEDRLCLWEHIQTAEILRGLGGGALVVWIEGDDPETPLDPAKITAQGITALMVKSRWHFQLGEIIFDLTNPWHGHPSYYQLVGMGLVRESVFGTSELVNLKLHPSRVIAFKGEEAPALDCYSWVDQFWGDSRVQVALNAVLNSDVSQQSFSGMIKDAVNVIIGIPGLTARFGSTQEIQDFQDARMSAVNAARSIWRAIVKDNGKGGPNAEGAETVDYRQMNWAGIPDVLMAFVYLVAAAGGMPATILLGKSPDGMNATGSGDLETWNREIDGRRETKQRPCLKRLDTLLIPSALGKADPSVWWKYGPLSTPTELDAAQAMFAKAQARQIYLNSGMLNGIAAEKALANTVIEEGILVGFDDALDEIPEDERYPSEQQPELDAIGQPIDPSALVAPGTGNPAKGGDPKSAGTGGAPDAARRLAVNDATPRTLYVSRKVQNVAEIAAWAKAQGIADLNDDLHVTIAYSNTPVDWIKMGTGWEGDSKGSVTITPGGPRVVEPLGNQTAVLMFASSDLSWRNMSMRDAGASWDWPDYQPHVSLTQAPVDLSKVQPYTGKIVLGPEIFEEIRAGDAED